MGLASIAISAKDEFSPVANSIRNAGNNLNKDFEALTQTYMALEKRQEHLRAELAKSQTDLVDTAKAVRDAKKEFTELNTETNRFRLDNANDELNKAKEATSQWKKSITETQRALKELRDEQSRMENRVSSLWGENASALMDSGVTQMLGDSLSGALNAGVSSALGDSMGNTISSVASSAISGALMGSVAGPIGTAIGAGVGAIAGGISAATDYFEKEDDAFRAVLLDIYTSQKDQIAADLYAGSAIAAGRETALISFSTLLGSREAAEEYLEEIRIMDARTPFNYDDLTSLSKILLPYGFEQHELLPTMSAIGDTGAALGLGQGDMETVASVIGRMYSSDKANLKYIMPLQDRGIDAIGAIAEEYGISQGDVYEAISKGTLSGTDVADALVNYLEKTFGGSMELQSQTYEGMISTLEGNFEERQNAMGEGYNEERKKSLETQINFMESIHGQNAEQAHYYLGQYEASLENERDSIRLKHEARALREIQAEGLEGADAGYAWKKAMAEAEAEYRASDLYLENLDYETQLLEDMREFLAENEESWKSQLAFSDEMSKGIASAAFWESGRDNLNAFYGDNTIKATPHAYGLDYVPFDDYPARLHEGERVLTAREAREMDADLGYVPPQPLVLPQERGDSGVPVNITVQEMNVRKESDIDAIASAIVAGIKEAKELAIPVRRG